MNHKSNGFLVVGTPKTINGISYCGIDTDVWPADVLPFSESTIQRYNDSVINYQKVFLLDKESAVGYYEYCCSNGIPARLLYCESTTEGTYYETIPSSTDLKNALFLGYDYAFPNGDYYSALANDVIYRNLDFSKKWKPLLNKHGLFSSFENILSFSKDRERTAVLANERSTCLVYEPGYFSVFRIFQSGG